MSQSLQQLAQPCCMGSGLYPVLCWPLSSSPCASAFLFWLQGQGNIHRACLMWETGPPGGTSLQCPCCLHIHIHLTWARLPMDLPSLLWDMHLPAKEPESGVEQTLPLQCGNPRSPAMRTCIYCWDSFMFLKGILAGQFGPKMTKNSLWDTGSVKLELQML